jgi:flagellar basal-body rod modification protein FlgD
MSPSLQQRKSVETTLAATAAGRATQDIGFASSSAAATAQAESTSGLINESVLEDSDLSKDAFLQLLVLELQNQDPLDPMDNKAMVTQLAQFSALEAQHNLNEKFEVLAGNVDQLNFISASQLLGKHVEGLDLNGEFRSGTVESVHLNGSIVVLSVDGELMSMAGIGRIDEPAEETAPEFTAVIDDTADNTE